MLRERKNIKRWYDQLEGDQKDSAKELLGKIEALEAGEADKKELYKASMLAFERLSITQKLSILNRLETEKDFKLISKIFGDLMELARVLYYDIAKGRVEIIKRFKETVDKDKKERVIQEHIFNALWLLDPSWELATTNMRMEETVTREFKKIDADLTDAERKARIDIRFQTVSGINVIIELKRYSVPVDVHDLGKQISKYKNALQKCLDEKFPDKPKRIEIFCIMGSRPSGGDDDTVKNHLAAYSARYMTYDELIDNALNSYQEYLNAEKRISELASIIDSLDEDFDTE